MHIGWDKVREMHFQRHYASGDQRFCGPTKDLVELTTPAAGFCAISIELLQSADGLWLEVPEIRVGATITFNVPPEPLEYVLLEPSSDGQTWLAELLASVPA